METKLTKLNELKMSATEKSRLLSGLRVHIAASEDKIPSPFSFLSFSLVSTFAVLFIIAAGSAAAESSLPGDILYGIKTNVNDKVIEMSAFGSSAKASAHITLVGRRLDEAQKLIETQKNTSLALHDLAEKIDEHSHAALAEIQDTKTDSTSTAATLASDLATTLDTHDVTLEELAAKDGIASTSTSTLVAATATTSPEVKEAQKISAIETKLEDIKDALNTESEATSTPQK